MAPGVVLYAIKVGDEVDLQNAADYVAANGIAVVNHSGNWVNASYYDDTGPINDIINESHDVDGVFWAVASGNHAKAHWRGSWSDPDADNRLNFTASDEGMGLVGVSASLLIFLNWNQYGNSVTDLDLYVLDKNGVIVASSDAVQTGPESPTEAVIHTYNPSQ